MSEMEKSSGDKKSPWKIPLLMLLSDIIVSLLCVFQFFILCFRKPNTLGDALNSSKDFMIHS